MLIEDVAPDHLKARCRLQCDGVACEGANGMPGGQRLRYEFPPLRSNVAANPRSGDERAKTNKVGLATILTSRRNVNVKAWRGARAGPAASLRAGVSTLVLPELDGQKALGEAIPALDLVAGRDGAMERRKRRVREDDMKLVTLAAIAGICLPSLAFAQTAEELVIGANDTSNVVNYGMGYNLQQFSTLKQIDKSNVRHLVPVLEL